MRIHAHVLVLDGHDSRAFTSKTRILRTQAEEMRRRGLPVSAAAPGVFHYSVPYWPGNPNSDRLYVVNIDQLAQAAFDEVASAVARAERFECHLRESDVAATVTINVVQLERGEQSERETAQIGLALALRPASM